MIQGSKPYKRKFDQEVEISPLPNDEKKNITSKHHDALTTVEGFKTSPNEDFKNEINSSRRALFASIIPSFGNGLVKLLRTSNNLKHELNEKLQKENK